MGTGHERLMTRRRFLAQTGRGVLGVAVLGAAAACSGSDNASGTTPVSDIPSAPQPSTSPSTAGSSAAGSSAAEESASGAAPAGGQLGWSRVDLGFVSAYVLVRGREAAVVDTGVSGSADAIGEVLAKAGPGWSGVRHVILTHKHPDHAGSIADVLTNAGKARGYLGTADLAEVDAPRPLTALRDGDDVFGLQILGTPGHTLGHMAVWDPDTGVLVAGDALNNTDGLAGSNPQFTEDAAAAKRTVAKLSRLNPKTILVGHGPPLTEDAADQLAELADSL